MPSFYRVKDLPGLEGLYIEGDLCKETTVGTVVSVRTIINANAVVGDRTVKFPLPPGSLWISLDCLVEAHDPTQEFSTENPFGEYLYESRSRKGDLEIIEVFFDNALTVTILQRNVPDKQDLTRTIYTQNFFDNRTIAHETVEEVLKGKLDPEDLVFSLRDLEERA